MLKIPNSIPQPAASCWLSYSITCMIIYLFIYMKNEWKDPSFFFFCSFFSYAKMTKLAHAYTPAGPQCSLRHSIWMYRVTFPKQHHPKLWQFAGRTLITVAGAQVLHAKHSAAKSNMCVYEWESLHLLVRLLVCVCVCAGWRGWRAGGGGHRGSICSLLLLCTDIRLR